MTNINWVRFLLGGLIASVIFFLSDGFLHEGLLKADWQAVYDGLKAKMPEESGQSMLYFAIFEFGRGFLSLFVYVLMRPFHGAGPKTAILAAVVGWLAFSVTAPAEFIPLGFYSIALWVKVAGFQLITSIIGTLAGAALYKGPAEAPTTGT